MIQGFLESAAPDLIQGWAFDDEAPTVRLVVRARRGKRLASGLAGEMGR